MAPADVNNRSCASCLPGFSSVHGYSQSPLTRLVPGWGVLILWRICRKIHNLCQSLTFEIQVSVFPLYFDVCSLLTHLLITLSQLWPLTTPYIKTFRLPTPLLIFQIALIPGSLLTGFLLSPLLYLSRHIAQRPVRRLRYPQEKQKHRRLLALGFYSGTLLIVGALIGLWTRWCLGGRDPWFYIVFWMLEGKNKWTRPALVAYWALLISLSVAGWTRQLARSKRRRQWNVRGSMQTANGAAAEALSAPTSPRYGMMPGQSGLGTTIQSASQAPQSASVGTGGPAELSDTAAEGIAGYGIRLPNLPNLPDIPNANLANVATDLLDAADKRVPTLSVNARRKFFHALAVVMFVPGIAVDVSASVPPSRSQFACYYG